VFFSQRKGFHESVNDLNRACSLPYLLPSVALITEEIELVSPELIHVLTRRKLVAAKVESYSMKSWFLRRKTSVMVFWWSMLLKRPGM
jgi:hypothetical protein